MIICKPFAEYWKNTNNIAQIAKAAKLCYASQIRENESIDDFIEEKWNMGHRSIFRHGTRYFVVPQYIINGSRFNNIKYNPFVTLVGSANFYGFSVNEQFYREHESLKELNNFEVDEESFLRYGKNDYALTKYTYCLRRSILVQTQISTSRELNRTSPNNICEQSTRYCNFTREKFNGDVRICEPHWLCVTTNPNTDEERDEVQIHVDNCNDINVFDIKTDTWYNTNEWPVATNGIPQKDGSALLYNPGLAENYIRKCDSACNEYNNLVKGGFLPQDARGVLPLDTATKVVYTYSLKEWKHILDLRYYGVTGAPHPNAKIAANLIRKQLNESQDFIKFTE